MTGRLGGLVTFGETMALVASGALAHATSAEVGMGGAESNVAIGVRRLGGRAAWIGRVGEDSLGTRILRELRAEDLDVHAVLDDTSPTGLMVKERRTSQASRVWYYRAGSAGSRLAPSDVPEDLVRGAGLLHLTGITPGLSDTAAETTRQVVRMALDSGVPISFDVNHRAAVWRGRETGAAAVYRELAHQATVVFAGEDEARLLTGTTTTGPAALLDELAAVAGGDVVLKLGADGCLADVDGERHAQPAVPVPVVDTVGAGDAFVAGYLAELLRGLPAKDRLQTAVRCGAFACLSPGDWEGLPTRQDLALLDGGDPVRR
jgi:2-dehydro-3-deoxygluconokinase